MLSDGRDGGTSLNTARPVSASVVAGSMRFVTVDCVRPAATNPRTAGPSSRAAPLMMNRLNQSGLSARESRIPNPDFRFYRRRGASTCVVATLFIASLARSVTPRSPSSPSIGSS